jgi:hypothetical protein
VEHVRITKYGHLTNDGQRRIVIASRQSTGESFFGGRTLAMLTLEGIQNMLWTIFVILLILWALGLVTSYTLGGFIHILLVLAVVVLVIRLIQGRRIA